MHDSPFILWDSHFLNTHTNAAHSRHTCSRAHKTHPSTQTAPAVPLHRSTQLFHFGLTQERLLYTLFLLSPGSDQGQIGKFRMQTRKSETKSGLGNAWCEALTDPLCPGFCRRWLTNGLKRWCTQIMWRRPHTFFVLKFIFRLTIHQQNVTFDFILKCIGQKLKYWYNL